MEALPAALAADGMRGPLDSLSISLDATKGPRAAHGCTHLIPAQHAPPPAQEATELTPAALPITFLLHQGIAGMQEGA